MSKGFALIETLIASLILSVFAASFAFLLNSGVKEVKRSAALSSSAFMSKSVLEEIISKPFDALYLYNGKSFDNGAGQITVAPAGNDIVSITVNHMISFTTLRSRY